MDSRHKGEDDALLDEGCLMADITAPGPYRTPSSLALSLTYAMRELRGGLRGFAIFLACIALGVASIAGVNALAQSMAGGLGQ
jgi:putative ABC transport system permease protein